MIRWKGVPPILAGRWQVPLVVIAVATAGVALYRMKPSRPSVPFDALVADVLGLARNGAYFDAADAAANLLELKPPLPLHQQAVLHSTLADIIYREELLRETPNPENAARLLKHHEAAMACGYTPDAQTALRAAQAHEWLGQMPAALNAYRVVLKLQPVPAARRTALQGLVRLLEGQPDADEERREYLQTLLDEGGVSPAYIWWAMQHALREAFDRGDTQRAQQLLAGHGQRFERSDLKGYHDFLWAWVYQQEGKTDSAWPLVDRVDAWLTRAEPADAEMDHAGFLPALSRWLRGCLHLDEGRPQDALECFEQARALQSHGDVLVMTTVGQVQALGQLQRDQTAQDVVREAVKRLQGDPTALSTGRPRLRAAVCRLAEERHKDSDYLNALGYLRLALDLTTTDEVGTRLDLLERLGSENAEAAELAVDADQRCAFHERAAQAYERAAELARFEDPRYAALLWAGAEQCDRAGHANEARHLLLRYVEGRGFDPRMPQALLRLGQAYAATGQFGVALDYFRQLTDRFPLLEEAWRARLLTASCLVAMGEAHQGEAKRILLDVLEDEQLTPRAPVFREALFELCDLFYQRQEFAEAISHLEDFLAFYPEDPEGYHIRFLLADAYRRSALVLLEDQAAGPQLVRQRVAHERLRRAAELFEVLCTDIVQAPADDQDRALYERLALFYHADCLYALNEPKTLAAALATYRQAAARYQGQPAALAAQIQIANVYLRQGKLTEAARAVERARWLLGDIPDAAFAEADAGMDRAAWGRFLNTVRSSSLFQDLLAEAP